MGQYQLQRLQMGQKKHNNSRKMRTKSIAILHLNAYYENAMKAGGDYKC